MKRAIWLILALLALAGGARAANSCTTCYSDYENGCDTNDGTQKTQTSGSCPTGGSGPWKHAPGMRGLTPGNASTGDGCASLCAAQVPTAGDKYILKGGVVWPYTAMPFAPYLASGGSNGSGSGSTFGCAGIGSTCIYYGSAVGAGLSPWNKGIVTAVTLTRDLGGWSSLSPPTVTCAGGGGSGVTVVLGIIPSTATEKAGFIYHTSLSSQGSGYTSAPICTVPNGAGQQTLFAADIDRPVMDMGATQASPPSWSVSGSAPVPYCGASGNYNVMAGFECRNILIQTYTGSNEQTGFMGTGKNSTLTNFYIHGLFVACAYPSPPTMSGTSCPSNLQQQQGAVVAANPYSEISYGTVENGDAFFLATPTSVAGNIGPYQNAPTEYGNFGIQSPFGSNEGPAEIQHVRIYGGEWQIRLIGQNASGTVPYLVHDSEFWLTLYDVNPSAHVNRRYSQLTGGTLISYNNFDHDHVNGSGNQQQCITGLTFYFFNEVIWGTGTSTPPYGLDPADAGGGGCTANFYNDTLYNPTSPYYCLNSGNATIATTVVMQNLHCITGPSALNPFWPSATDVTFENYAGSSVTANVQAASVVQGISTANGQGYTLGNLYAPTSGSATVAFATGGDSVNLSSLCTGYLAPLCSDINGRPRLPAGGWQAGAYVSQNLLPPVLSRTLQ